MNNEIKLTKAQAAGLEKIKAGQFEPITTGPNTGHVKTGVNTKVLCSLKKMGLITMSKVYLNGVTSADIQVIG